MPAFPDSFRFSPRRGIPLLFRNTDRYTLWHLRESWSSREGHSPLACTSGTYWYTRRTVLLLSSLHRIGWCPSIGIPRIFWGLGIPVVPLSEVREYTKSRSWFDLRQNTRREMDSLFRRRSYTMGTLTFRSIYRVTRGDTVHEEVIFALWRFRSTGRFLWSLTLLPPGVLRGTCRSCRPRGIRRWSPRTLSFHLLSSYNTVDSRWSYRRRNSLVDPICPWCLNSGDSV